jgi:predicted dehydrogenase
MNKIAIIGLGSMGKNHFRILSTIPNIELVALCDPMINSNDYDQKTYVDLDLMLKEQQIDMAIIAVPTSLHKSVALKCLDYGINLFVEKPIAIDVKSANEILEKAKETKAKVRVGYIERFNPVIQSLKNELKDKEIYSINITRVGPFMPRNEDSGILTDLGVHDIDLIRFITERKILKTTINKSQKVHKYYEDNAVLACEMENEIMASITTNWLTPFKKRTIEVACKEGYFEADLISQELVEYSNYKLNNSFVTRNCFVKKGEPLLFELKEFIRFVSTSIDTKTDLASIEDSIISLEVIDAK